MRYNGRMGGQSGVLVQSTLGSLTFAFDLMPFDQFRPVFTNKI